MSMCLHNTRLFYNCLLSPHIFLLFPSLLFLSVSPGMKHGSKRDRNREKGTHTRLLPPPHCWTGFGKTMIFWLLKLIQKLYHQLRMTYTKPLFTTTNIAVWHNCIVRGMLYGKFCEWSLKIFKTKHGKLCSTCVKMFRLHKSLFLVMDHNLWWNSYVKQLYKKINNRKIIIIF